MNNLCQYLNWDSDFFGYRIARVAITLLDQDTAKAIKAWCISHKIDCLYFLADATDKNTTRLAEDNDFRLVDIRVTLEKRIKDNIDFNNSQERIRPCTIHDISYLKNIARVSHRDTRFYYDENFSPTLGDALYETWIEKSCKGYADAVFVAVVQEQPTGYISCHLSDDHLKGQIGLIAVGSDWRGMRLGQDLVNRALHWFAEQNIMDVSVVTQGRNCAAQRLYQRCGFQTSLVQLWYHLWFTI